MYTSQSSSVGSDTPDEGSVRMEHLQRNRDEPKMFAYLLSFYTKRVYPSKSLAQAIPGFQLPCEVQKDSTMLECGALLSWHFVLRSTVVMVFCSVCFQSILMKS